MLLPSSSGISWHLEEEDDEKVEHEGDEEEDDDAGGLSHSTNGEATTSWPSMALQVRSPISIFFWLNINTTALALQG